MKPKGSPLLHFSALCHYFWKKKYSKIFLKKIFLRFLSLRYSADFRRSRLVCYWSTGIVASMGFPTFVADHGCVSSPPNMMIHMALDWWRRSMISDRGKKLKGPLVKKGFLKKSLNAKKTVRVDPLGFFNIHSVAKLQKNWRWKFLSEKRRIMPKNMKGSL